jgi:hypothetical protein
LGIGSGRGRGSSKCTSSHCIGGEEKALTKTQVGSLILFLYSLHLQPVDRFSRKIFFLSPLLLTLNSLLMFGAAIPVTIFGRNRSAVVKGFIGSVQLPDATIKAASTIPAE